MIQAKNLGRTLSSYITSLCRNRAIHDILKSTFVILSQGRHEIVFVDVFPSLKLCAITIFPISLRKPVSRKACEQVVVITMQLRRLVGLRAWNYVLDMTIIFGWNGLHGVRAKMTLLSQHLPLDRLFRPICMVIFQVLWNLIIFPFPLAERFRLLPFDDPLHWAFRAKRSMRAEYRTRSG